MTLYTIQSARFEKFNKNQPFWGDKYSAALNADSHPLGSQLDANNDWIYVHEVELLTDGLSPHIFDTTNPDHHLYLNGLGDAESNKFYTNLSLGEWSYRVMQKPKIRSRLIQAHFIGYISKMNGCELLSFYDPNKYQWGLSQSWDYSYLIDEYDDLKGDGGIYEFNNN